MYNSNKNYLLSATEMPALYRNFVGIELNDYEIKMIDDFIRRTHRRRELKTKEFVDIVDAKYERGKYEKGQSS